MVRCTSFVSYKVTKVLNVVFEWLGESIYKKPWLFIIIGIAVTVAAGSGLMSMEMETATINLWVPTTTEIYSDFKKEEAFFGESSSVLILLLKGRKNQNIMTAEGLTQAYQAMATISNISNVYDGKEYSFADICLRVDITSTSCVADKFNLHSMFFNDDETLWNDQAAIDSVLDAEAATAFLGSLQYGDSDEVIGANVIRIIYQLTPSTDNDFNDALKEYQRAWTDYWKQHENDFGEFEAVYFSTVGADDEMLATMVGDSMMFVIAFSVMLVYLQLTLGGRSCIRMRVWLATSSIIVLLCALIFGFGISAYLGNKFSTLVFVVPFLLLGVGVDNMIIIVDTVNHTTVPNSDSEQQFTGKQLGVALKHCGVAVSLTSFCSIVAFLAGSVTDLPGLGYFCYYAAFSFVGNYLLQFLLFVPLLVYDNKRIQQNRNFCCPCFAHTVLANADEYNDDELEQPTKRFSLNWFLENSFVAILSSTIGRICIIILFLTLIAFSAYFGMQIETSSDMRLFLLDESYAMKYFDLVEVAWSGSTTESIQIVFIDVDFSEAAMRKRIYSLMQRVEDLSDVQSQVDNWLEPFAEYVADEKNINIDDIADKLTFYQYLKDFEAEIAYIHWEDELIFDNDESPTKVAATRFYFSALQPNNFIEKYDSYQSYNELTAEIMGTEVDCFMMQSEWVYAYLDSNLKTYTLTNLLISTAAVLLILFLLMDIRLAIFIMLVIVGIDVCLFGWMYLVGIELQVISFAQLCMAVGLTVDYVIHMTHAIAETKLDGNHNMFANRIKIAFALTGSSVIKGALTTFIGACVLAFAQSLSFRMFFNMLAGIIMIASCFGLLFGPAVMGQFSFIYVGLDALQYEMEEEPAVEYHGVAVDSKDEADSKDDQKDEDV